MTARVRFRDAKPADVPTITGLLNATAGALVARFGDGPWAALSSERGVTVSMRHARFRLGVIDRRIVSVLRLAQKKPWAIDPTCFSAAKRPLYLTSMAVSVATQRTGLGRLALEDAREVARDWPADALRLDAWDAAAGAGGFYAACGFAERGRVTYRRAPLIYFETMV